MLDHVGIGTAVLLDVVGIELNGADRAVSRIRGVAVRVRERIRRVEGETAAPPTQQLDLKCVELAAAGVRHNVHVVAVQGVRQPRIVRRNLRIERDGACAQRVVVAVHQELPHRRADVADARAHLAAQLALHCHVVLVDVRALEVGIDPLVPEISQIHGWCSAGEAIAEPAAAPRSDEPEFVGGEQVPDALDCDGRMEQAKAAAQHGLIALVEAPGIADSRTEVVLVGADQGVRQTCLVGCQRAAERNQAGRQQLSNLRIRHHVMTAVDRQEVREGLIVLVPRPDDFIAQPEEERQALVDAPVVLAEEGNIIRVALERSTVGYLVAHVGGHAQQKVGERVSGERAAEPILAAEIDPEAKPVASEVAGPQAAVFQRVRPDD